MLQKISKDMTIGELVNLYPSVVEILLAEGVHCVGCGAAYDETVEQGLSAHGKTDAEINDVVHRLNEAVPEQFGSPDTIFVTEKAAVKLKELLKQQKNAVGLRVEVVAGGCSGQQYAFDFETKQNDGDTVLDIEGVKFFVDKNSIELLRGAKVDYVESLQGAGFKISNPSAHHTCGCGQSFN